MYKKKFYDVAIGRKSGIYLTWPECQEQVLGYPKAQFAAFETMEKRWSIVSDGVLLFISQSSAFSLFLTVLL